MINYPKVKLLSKTTIILCILQWAKNCSLSLCLNGVVATVALAISRTHIEGLGLPYQIKCTIDSESRSRRCVVSKLINSILHPTMFRSSSFKSAFAISLLPIHTQKICHTGHGL